MRPQRCEFFGPAALFKMLQERICSNQVYYSLEVVTERAQTELSSHIFQPEHEERLLIHPELDRAKGMFNQGLTPCD